MQRESAISCTPVLPDFAAEPPEFMAAQMASTHSVSYPLGGTQTELQRLLAQAEVYEHDSNWLLDQSGIQPGWRAVDVGCLGAQIELILAEADYSAAERAAAGRVVRDPTLTTTMPETTRSEPSTRCQSTRSPRNAMPRMRPITGNT